MAIEKISRPMHGRTVWLTEDIAVAIRGTLKGGAIRLPFADLGGRSMATVVPTLRIAFSEYKLKTRSDGDTGMIVWLEHKSNGNGAK